MNNKKITIMTSQNSYLNNYTEIIKKSFAKYICEIVNNKEDIKSGDVAFS